MFDFWSLKRFHSYMQRLFWRWRDSQDTDSLSLVKCPLYVRVRRQKLFCAQGIASGSRNSHPDSDLPGINRYNLVDASKLAFVLRIKVLCSLISSPQWHPNRHPTEFLWTGSTRYNHISSGLPLRLPLLPGKLWHRPCFTGCTVGSPPEWLWQHFSILMRRGTGRAPKLPCRLLRASFPSAKTSWQSRWRARSQTHF